MALRIGPRIASASLIVLALLGAVSAISITTLDDLEGDFGTYRESSRDGALAASLQASIMNARVNVKEFLLSGSHDDEQQVRSFLRDTDALVAEADREIQNPERRRHHDVAKAALKGYAGTFDRVVDLERSLVKLRTKRLDVNGPRVEKALSAIMRSAHEDGDLEAAFNAGEAMRSLLLARLYVQKHLDRQDPSAAARVRQEFADFEREHADLLGHLESPERRRLAADAATLFADYKGAFEEAVSVAAEMHRLIERELNPAGAAILASVDAIRTSLASEQEQVGEHATAQIAASETETTVLAVVALLLGLGAAWLIGRSIARPVTAMTEVMARLAGGDTSIAVPSLKARDEIGDMARAVEVFKANAIETERLRHEQEAARARAEAERRRALQDMADTVEREAGHAVEAVAGRTTRMAQDAEGMARSAERVSQNAQSVATAAQQALATAQTVATAAEELSASIREITGQVAHSTAVTRRAVEDGRQTQATIRSLSEAVGRIGEVASLIGDIAGQTNLLALNATIEAARAGEAGKGFAVVASEVKNLANQTARSTEEITRQIGDIQSVTATAVSAVEGIGRTIGEIDGVSSTIAAAMEEQAAATQEISRNVVETTHAAQEVSARIAAVSQEANATGEQAAHVREDSGEVAEGIQALRQTLVQVVRTATGDADRQGGRAAG